MRGSKYRRTKAPHVWTLVYDIKTESGKRKQRSVTFRGTAREADKELARLVSSADSDHSYSTESKITVAAFLEHWLVDHVTPNLAPKTAVVYAGMVHNHIIPYIGTILLEKLRPTDIVRLQTNVRDTGRLDTRTGRLATATLRHVYATLRSALETAVKWKLIPSNPCDAVTPPKWSTRKEMQALSPDAARTLLIAAETEGLYWQTFFTVAITTGLRIGELRGLCWKEIDMSNKTLTVVQTVQHVTGRGTFAKATKTAGSRRKVQLGNDVITLLRKHKAAQNEVRLAAGKDWQDLDLVFHGLNGSYLGEYPIRRVFQRMLDASRLGPMRLHDLRHTAATLLLTAGIHPKVVSERLGHSNITITLQLYSHVSETLQHEAAEAIDGLLKEVR